MDIYSGSVEEEEVTISKKSVDLPLRMFKTHLMESCSIAYDLYVTDETAAVCLVNPTFLFRLLSWVCSLLAKNKRLHSIQLYSLLYRAQLTRIYNLRFWQEEPSHDRILTWKTVPEG